MNGTYQKLFTYMSKEHGVNLIEQDMQEICLIVSEKTKQGELAGYLFDGRFYKNIDELRGKTMNKYNAPIPLYYPQNYEH